MPEATRKVILGLGISLDGYIARLDGSVDFLFMPKDYSMKEFNDSVDVSIMGRKTLDVSLSFGASYKKGDPTKTFVYSRTHKEGVEGGLTYTRQGPAALVAKIREKPGKNIWLMGGGEIAREFLQADAVDGLYLGIVPVLLGEGLPLFPAGFPQRNFTLVKNETFSQGLIAVTYERDRKPAKKKKTGTNK
jgi:dihydrofolate reductase